MRPIAAAALMLSAGSTLAQGQAHDTLIPADRAQPITIDQITGGDYLRNQLSPYSPRLDVEVYHIGLPTETGGAWATSGINAYDDANFAGPYTSNTSPLPLNGMAIGFYVPATFPDPQGMGDNIYTRVSFYPNHSDTTTPTPYGGTPIVAVLNWGAGWTSGTAPGAGRYYPNPVSFGSTYATLSNADVFNGGPTDRTAGVKIEPFLDAALTARAQNYQIMRRANFTGWKVGSGDTFGWFSQPSEVASGEIAQSSRSGGGALGTNSRATYMGFQGWVPTDPFFTPDLGTLADGTTQGPSSAYSGTQVRWHVFTLPADATDPRGAFIDLDLEGAAGDFSLAIYNGNSQSPDYGDVITFDQDSGSGVNPMLSFGMGRRAAVGNGRQYDGRNTDGSRGLRAGRYFVAMAPAGSAFTDGFGVTPGTFPAPAQSRLMVRTNVNAAVLAPSVAPAIEPGDSFPGPIIAPGTAFPARSVRLDTPRWLYLNNCHGASDAEPITIHWDTTTTVFGISATVFDTQGNLINQMSTPSNTPAPFVFSSSNPLPAGPLYIALAASTVELQPTNPATNGRWHLRSVGANANHTSVIGGRIAVVNQDCCTSPAPCGGADYNGDGDSGTDLDIEAFFACIAGNCCFTCYCGGADFNGDGDIGTDADIESFFRVLAGGPC